ncbi:ubiquitin-conjugating enzyme E2 W-like protein [Martensiomyces pterosporus]|nr:ubiquitin-conjugating enzyme E2 W-like protein [Martensiomyces pterosporus]
MSCSPLRTKRLLRELRQMKRAESKYICLETTNNIDKWLVRINGVEGTLYANEKFTLLFSFPDDYPLEAPEVTFHGSVPVHPHIYSNGHICLSILYKYWCPVLTVDAICLSILSMLSSCEKKVPPERDQLYVKKAKASPKDTIWVFDDVSV